MMKLYLKQCEVVHFLVVIVSMEVGKVNFDFFFRENKRGTFDDKRLGGPKAVNLQIQILIYHKD